MSTFTHESMINIMIRVFDPAPRDPSCLAERRQQRRQLAELSDRDLHDVGLSWSDIVFEAEKAVLAGLNAAGPASPQKRDAGRRFFCDQGKCFE